MIVFTLFANTGVQRFSTGIKSKQWPDWWTFQDISSGRLEPWLYVRSVDGFVVFAVDTRTGPREQGFFAEDEAAIRRPAIELEIPDESGKQIDIRIDILPESAGVGKRIDVAFVLDFGNCRTLGLLVEQRAAGFKMAAVPFVLYDHAKMGLDDIASPDSARIWERSGEKVHALCAEFFDSRFDFVGDRLPEVWIKVGRKVTVSTPVTQENGGLLGGIFGRGRKPDPPPAVRTVWENVVSPVFPDISAVRMGVEADRFRALVRPEEGVVTGMSSPKRYLWSARPTETMWWHQILAQPRGKDGRCFEPVNGRVFGYVYEDDADWAAVPQEDPAFDARTKPACPSYPRRSMMVFCLYELLAQAYSQINSISYRTKGGLPLVKRHLSHLVLTFPTAMCREEIDRYRKQAGKAVSIFSKTMFTSGEPTPRLVMTTDEGSASQFAYVYGESLAFGRGGRWLEHVGRKDSYSGLHRARVASLDIGGGTTDMMIADYTDKGSPPATDLACEIRHLDGVSKAGDELVKCLVEQVIIPRMANILNMSKGDVRTIFEDVSDGMFNAEKRRWVSEIWVPVARRYLALAEEEDEQQTFLLREACPNVPMLEEMQRVMRGRGVDVADPGGVELKFERDVFERVLLLALGRMLWQFASTVSAFDCDILLLAGRTTRLPSVQRLLRQYLPLPASRIVPLDRFHTGPWYPLPDPRNPGKIGDPKSAVVVGSSIQFLSSCPTGLGSFRISVSKSPLLKRSYYWGVATEAQQHFRNSEALFTPCDGDGNDDQATLQLVGREAIIARRMTPNEDAEVSPVYCVELPSRKWDAGAILVTVKRVKDGDDERLELVAADGMIGDEVAKAGDNVRMSLRTMFTERYFLDTEAFFNINCDAVTRV